MLESSEYAASAMPTYGMAEPMEVPRPAAPAAPAPIPPAWAAATAAADEDPAPRPMETPMAALPAVVPKSAPTPLPMRPAPPYRFEALPARFSRPLEPPPPRLPRPPSPPSTLAVMLTTQRRMVSWYSMSSTLALIVAPIFSKADWPPWNTLVQTDCAVWSTELMMSVRVLSSDLARAVERAMAAAAWAWSTWRALSSAEAPERSIAASCLASSSSTLRTATIFSRSRVVWPSSPTSSVYSRASSSTLRVYSSWAWARVL